MKPDGLRNASSSVRRLNPAIFASGDMELQSSKPQQAVLDGSLAEAQGACFYTTRCLVRVTSYRCGQLCDPDNLAPKAAIDALRYARILQGDRPEDINYEVRQKRVKTRKEERTEIEIIPLP